ncbi:hypothetical protein M5K25_025798 [Dendrobium thyrsiflorum]|uniref:CSC1/OSCA1-like 7TM region domain-containing protein n=1 Tax=Dendrobium thyrsiflorum TaxID=117978 RepID=A0ABD0UA08_DENTH
MVGDAMMSPIKIPWFHSLGPLWSLVYLVRGGSRPNQTKGSLSAAMGCVVQGYLVNLGVIGELTGSSHDRNLVVSFGYKPPGSESPGHNRLPAVPFGRKTAGFCMNIKASTMADKLITVELSQGLTMKLLHFMLTAMVATFFITYVLTSGWTSLCAELVQCFPLTYNLLQKYVFRKKLDDPSMVPTFPYHTEVPRVLLFGLLGFTCSILAPLILPFLMVYFLLGYLIYRNQMLNVYRTKYESGGQLWPVVHNSTIFSLVLAQIIALGVFGIKKSTVASGLIVPLVIFTLLFHEYCRKRFLPIFKNFSAQALVEMDREDEMSGKMEEIHRLLQSAYCQPTPKDKDKDEEEDEDDAVDGGGAENSASVI